MAPAHSLSGAPFEQDIQYYLPPLSQSNNPTGDWGLAPSSTATNYGLGENNRYICVWRNDSPLLVRIIVKFDDPTNRLKEGQSVEMVFKIK